MKFGVVKLDRRNEPGQQIFALPCVSAGNIKNLLINRIIEEYKARFGNAVQASSSSSNLREGVRWARAAKAGFSTPEPHEQERDCCPIRRTIAGD